jgi:hypothetical protein
VGKQAHLLLLRQHGSGCSAAANVGRTSPLPSRTCCTVFHSSVPIMAFTSRHVLGVSNDVADALSRNQVYHVTPVLSRVPMSCARPCPQALHCRDARLGLTDLDRLVLQLAGRRATTRVYESGQCRFLAFCTHFSLIPLPATESVLCHFVAFLAASSMSYGSVRSYLSAIRHLHIMSGIPDPSLTPLAQLVYSTTGGSHDPTS